MRKGQTVRLTEANAILAPGIAAGEVLTVLKGFWCDYHNEGCLIVRVNPRPPLMTPHIHVPDILFEIVKKGAK